MAPLDRVLDTLEYVAERGSVRVGQLCEDLHLPRPTAHRLVSALVGRGYLTHDPLSHLYRPGPSMVSIGVHAANSSLVYHAEPALVRLRDATGETANLAVIRGGRIVYAATLDGSLFPRMSVSVGQDVPPHAAAIGKAILAQLGEADRTRLLGPEPYPRFTERTLQYRKQLEAELMRTAARGYAVDNEEVTTGAVCIAGAILDEKGQPLGAMSLSATVTRFPAGRWDDLGAVVTESCSHVSGLLKAAASRPSR
jgi:IclR family acetate operon transcriptional repressor